eukprot:800226_1
MSSFLTLVIGLGVASLVTSDCNIYDSINNRFELNDIHNTWFVTIWKYQNNMISQDEFNDFIRYMTVPTIEYMFDADNLYVVGQQELIAYFTEGKQGIIQSGFVQGPIYNVTFDNNCMRANLKASYSPIFTFEAESNSSLMQKMGNKYNVKSNKAETIKATFT